MSETSFYGYCKEINYREFDAAALKDGVVVKIGTHRLLKVSKLGGWCRTQAASSLMKNLPRSLSR